MIRWRGDDDAAMTVAWIVFAAIVALGLLACVAAWFGWGR